MTWIFEPEETIGRQWHRLVSGTGSWPRHPSAAVRLDDVQGRLGVMFRALGGAGAARIAATGTTASRHRLGAWARLGFGMTEKIEVSRFDGATLLLPPLIDLLQRQADNEALYEWLVVWFALKGDEANACCADLLQEDVVRLRQARAHTAHLLAVLPGLRPMHDRLSAELRQSRPRRSLFGDEAAVEAAVCASIGDDDAAVGLPHAMSMLDMAQPVGSFHAGRRYRPFLPVPLWGEVVVPVVERKRPVGEDERANGTGAPTDLRRHNAKRRENEQTRRRDPLALNRFETILGLAEMVNLNRPVEDDDEEAARKAADDLDEIAVGEHERRAATSLKLELDLPSAAITTESLHTTALTFPEWDYRRGLYHRDHCRVIAEVATAEGEDWKPDEASRRRIRRVQRQFEALRPRRQVLHAQPDGDELDLSSLVRALADHRAGAAGSERVFSAARTNQRDLAVAVLVDVSLSTDSWVEDRRVLDVEKEALLALGAGLEACGDQHAIFVFTSRRRHAVWVRTVKDFSERFDALVARRIGALRPGYYTRMGAAVRHAAQRLAERPEAQRLLLLLTDGKPNDADHYEGRYAVEDTRRAIREARRAGSKVFGITVDREARDYFPHLFGPGAYAICPNVSRLVAALPKIYQQVTA